jgi:mono/diheme cytochrome c family protein
MDFLETKTITNSYLAFSLVGLGVISAIFILLLIGRTTPPKYPRFLRWAHRITGYIFFAFYLFIGVIMFKKLEEMNVMPTKAAIHAYIGVSIFPLIIIKICINRFFKKFYKSLPIYGVLILIAVYFQIPLYAGLYIISAIKNQYVTLSENGRQVRVNVNMGRKVVQQKCSTCHSLERVYAYFKTEEGWRDYVSRMREKDPTIINNQEAREALGYLVKNLGIDEAKMDIQIGMRIILEKCHRCHTLERVFTAKMTQGEWVLTIEKMRSFDPDLLNDSEARQVNYYLSKVLARQKTGQHKLETYRISRNQIPGVINLPERTWDVNDAFISRE